MFVPAISPCLETQKGGLRGPDTQAYVVGSLPASLGKVLGHNKDEFIVFDTTQITSPTNGSNPQPGDPCHPVTAQGHAPAVAFDWQSGGDMRGLNPKPTAQLQRSQVPAVAWSIMPMNSGKDYKARATDVAQPIMAGGPVGGNQGGDYVAQPAAFGDTARTLSARHDGSPCADRGPDVIAVQSAVRRLTPVECERLQGFPDNFTAIPWRNKPANACPDGPRYKALGNSMAVPVMRWIGERIQMVEKMF
jgi:DNA (cytosine-5)-methyltransferase 1